MSLIVNNFCYKTSTNEVQEIENNILVLVRSLISELRKYKCIGRTRHGSEVKILNASLTFLERNQTKWLELITKLKRTNVYAHLQKFKKTGEALKDKQIKNAYFYAIKIINANFAVNQHNISSPNLRILDLKHDKCHKNVSTLD